MFRLDFFRSPRRRRHTLRTERRAGGPVAVGGQVATSQGRPVGIDAPRRLATSFGSAIESWIEKTHHPRRLQLARQQDWQREAAPVSQQSDRSGAEPPGRS